jgi:hypothetical protein
MSHHLKLFTNHNGTCVKIASNTPNIKITKYTIIYTVIYEEDIISIYSIISLFLFLGG